MHLKIFKPNLKLVIIIAVVYIINIIIILQLAPVLESQTIQGKIINLLIFPSNFIFEDMFNITSIRIIDFLSWFLLFLYDYMIVMFIIYFKGGLR